MVIIITLSFLYIISSTRSESHSSPTGDSPSYRFNVAPPLFLLPIQNKNNIGIDNKNSDVIFKLATHPNGWDSQQSWRDR